MASAGSSNNGPGAADYAMDVDMDEGFIMDPESAALIAQLQLEDAALVVAGSKGKGRADAPPPDLEIALRLQTEEFSGWEQLYRDAALAQSIGNAIEMDARLLEAYRLMEETAVADRRAAELLEGGATDLPPLNEAQKIVGEDKDFAKIFDFHTIADSASNVAEQPNQDFSIGVSGSRKTGPSVDRNKRIWCTGCGEQLRIQDTLGAPCDHYYCAGCITRLVESSLTDETLHPIRCCRESIPTAGIAGLIKNADLWSRFEAKRIEYETPGKTRVYCSTPTCSSFLGSSEAHIASSNNARFVWAPCASCNTQTCVSCGKPAHPGDTCSQNEATEEVRALAKTSGWQTCPNCQAIIDLHHGCNHMTCRCRTEFCYECGVLWKTCRCEQWDEHRLVVTAELRVENALGGQVVREVQPEAFVQQVMQAVEHLRVNHGCDRHRWTETRGGTCEECHTEMKYFLKMCRNCGLHVCKPCALNRL
ncbi:hypothetical protein FA15DRAFT_675837 [Coprinopsis marcescibilis]|uniref:RBR-type E3 ubiquitin transferase n=1 Tax=Coprinopsis marcescibilis TaxID=230819 RepID=A0A5C3KDN8_COPMA|nr:hypothetical protein FA15DRAFT_675837 [Coprinopsis marcescibilis]